MSTPSINALIIGGNLTRDPQLKLLANDNAVASFGIANSRKRKAGTDQVEDVVFLDCEAWGKTAEMIAKWFTKGKPILCEGRLKQETWPDGRPVYTIPLCLSMMVFYAFAMQCLSTVAVVRRETQSWKWPLFQLAYMTGTAYILAVAVFQITRLLLA